MCDFLNSPTAKIHGGFLIAKKGEFIMKKSFAVVVLMLGLVTNDALAGGYLALGEMCFPGGTFENEGICAPGMLCFFKPSLGYGHCMSDCSVMDDETTIKDTSWNNWGGIPFDWFPGNTGYLHSQCVRSSCLNSESGCLPETVYACDMGYYGRSSNGTSGCAKCPSDGMSMIWRMGGFDITDCFIPANSERSDSTGTYKFTADCYYSL